MSKKDSGQLHYGCYNWHRSLPTRGSRTPKPCLKPRGQVLGEVLNLGFFNFAFIY